MHTDNIITVFTQRLTHFALTDPCKMISRYSIPKHLAHNVILSAISVFQLEKDSL